MTPQQAFDRVVRGLVIEVDGVRTDQLHEINLLERAGMALLNEYARRA